MRLTAAIDAYIEDMRLQGRINSPATERDYRGALIVLIASLRAIFGPPG